MCLWPDSYWSMKRRQTWWLIWCSGSATGPGQEYKEHLGQAPHITHISGKLQEIYWIEGYKSFCVSCTSHLRDPTLDLTAVGTVLTTWLETTSPIADYLAATYSYIITSLHTWPVLPLWLTPATTWLHVHHSLFSPFPSLQSTDLIKTYLSTLPSS